MSITVFDADNHLYETEEAFTRHLPDRHRNLFRFVEVDGRKKLVVRGYLSDFIPNPTFEVVARPGAHMDYYTGNTNGRTLREIAGKPMRSIPAFREPQARLELLDEQGLAATIMYPTLASVIEERFIDDPELTQVAIGAFNEWLHEQWSFNYENRILTTPVVNPCVLESGIAGLELALERGAKAVLMRPGPVAGLRGTRSPFLPEFDPFWARVEESGVLVVLHGSDSGYQKYLNTWEGGDGEFVAFDMRPFRVVADGGKIIQDTFASAICHGMLNRFPGVRLISVENGGTWVGGLFKNLKEAFKKMPQAFAEDPIDVFRRQVWVSPFWEESLDTLIELVGADRICYGSDYPHPEGLADPASFVKEIDSYDPALVQKIMGGNLAELLPGVVTL